MGIQVRLVAVNTNYLNSRPTAGHQETPVARPIVLGVSICKRKRNTIKKQVSERKKHLIKESQ